MQLLTNLLMKVIKSIFRPILLKNISKLLKVKLKNITTYVAPLPKQLMWRKQPKRLSTMYSSFDSADLDIFFGLRSRTLNVSLWGCVELSSTSLRCSFYWGRGQKVQHAGDNFFGERYGVVWWAFRRRKLMTITIANALRWCGRNMWANHVYHRPFVSLRQIIDYFDLLN